MPDLPEYVLLGVPDAQRRAFISGLLEESFLVHLEESVTFDDLQGKFNQIGLSRNWKIVLIDESLPWGFISPGTVLPVMYFEKLFNPMSDTSLVCVTIGPNLPQDFQNCRIRVHHIPIPTTNPTRDEHQRFVSAFAEFLTPAFDDPEVRLTPNDAPLIEQLRSLNDERDLEQSKRQIGRLASRFFRCNSVVVAKLGQGVSGAKVFRISPELGGATLGEYVLKLCPIDSQWKILAEVEGHTKARSALSHPGYTRHVPELRDPRLPCDTTGAPVCKTAAYGGWYAVCYDFLGGARFGKFLDLETAATASDQDITDLCSGTNLTLRNPTEARLEVMGHILTWLCSEWYNSPTRSRRDERTVWSTQDAPAREYVCFPPYKLTARTKAWVLDFLAGTGAILGPRLLPEWAAHCDMIWDLVGRAEGETGLAPLDGRLNVRISPAHGDLNTKNVLLWLNDPYHPFLIDFPMFQAEGHALQDIARLETDVVLAHLDNQRSGRSPTAYDHAYDRIELWRVFIDTLLDRPSPLAGAISTDIANDDCASLSLKFVQMLRDKAIEGQRGGLSGNDPDFMSEYLPALLYHSIRAISYPTLSIFKRLLAVYLSGSIIERMRDA